MKIFQVGGSVRDELLGVEPKDRDWVVVNSSPEEMEEKGFKPIGKDFPVFLHPDTNEEYALARTERKSGVGYKGFKFYFDSSVTLEEDLKRRDFTINAMAKDDNGHIIDPYGGRVDLKNKIFKPLTPIQYRYCDVFRRLGFPVDLVNHEYPVKPYLDSHTEEQKLLSLSEKEHNCHLIIMSFYQ